MQISEIQISYTSPPLMEKIRTSSDLYSVLIQSWDMNVIDLYEEFKIVFLNRALYVLGVYTLSKGGTSNTFVDLRLLFSTALKANASSIVLAHNHPSGNLAPSESDIAITKKVVEAGKLLEIVVLEHLIMGRNGYYSFTDEGLI